MNKFNLSKIVNSVQSTITEHAPEILTGLGIAGMLTTTILAVQATPKALILLQDAKIKKADEQVVEGKTPDEIDDTLTRVEVIKETWKCYIPAAVTGVVSMACLIGASSVNVRRNAALATAYTLSETALKEYQTAALEAVGEKKEQSIRDQVAKNKIEHDPVTTREVIITDTGNTLCYDAMSKRYFMSDIEKIRKAENIINRRMLDEMWVTLNEFYYEIGLDGTPIGEKFGWDVDQGLIEITFSTQLSDDDRPCLVVDYRTRPDYKRH